MIKRYPRYWLIAGLASGLLLLNACSSVQTTSAGAVGVERKQLMSSLVSESSLNNEAAKQYATIVNQARSSGKLDQDSTQASRVRTIAQRLIQQVGVFRPDASNWAWEVHVVNEDEVNAWCMPGGKIAVYSGLIQKIQPTDAELAAVIGHEIAHALREHAREQVYRQMGADIGLSVLAAVTGSQTTANLGAELNKVMFSLPNSRSHETEADLIGVELAARAGFDPRAAISLWQKMGAVGGSRPPEFLSTHPAPATRMADLKKVVNRVLPLYQ